MSLQQRLMWPRVGEEISVYKHGKINVEGIVTYANDSVISVLKPDMTTVNLDCAELLGGIQNRSIVIQKKPMH